MTHDELKALLPLAALDRLEPDEIESLREHLAGCEECDSELREFEHAVAMLALAVDAPASEDRVTRKLEARLAAPAPPPVVRITAPPVPTVGVPSAAPAPVKTPAAPIIPGAEPGMAPRTTPAPAPPRDREPTRAPEPMRREGGRWVRRLAIAAALLLALFGAAVTSRLMDLKRAYDDRGDKLAYLQNRFTTLQHDAEQEEQKIDALSKVLSERVRLEQVLDAPDLRVTRLTPLPPAPEAHAMVALSKTSGDAVLRASGLTAPPAGKTYEFWWITKQKGPVPAGTFAAESGKDVVAKVDPPPAGDRVMAAAVTIEPAGGVQKPTGAMYLKGSPDHE